MDTVIANRLIQTIYKHINNWYHQLKTDYPLYDLTVVGGIAYNTVVSASHRIQTQDLDLKLVYREPITPRNYYSMFTFTFNKLRTQIMLDLAHAVRCQINEDPNLKKYFRDGFHQFQRDYLTVAIKYKLPYLIYDYGDTLKCCRQHREMTHMVMSLIYHKKGSSDVTSLVDLSMFVNLNNPDRLYHLPLNNYIYLSGQGLPISNQMIILTQEGIAVPVALVGHLIKDLVWLSMLHHKEERRDRVKAKINLLITELSNIDDKLTSLLQILTYLIEVNYLEIGFTQLNQHYMGVKSPDIQYSYPKAEDLSLAVLKAATQLDQLSTLDYICSQLDTWQSEGLIPTYVDGLNI